MTFFVTLGWENFGGVGLLAIALTYACVLAGAGIVLRRRGLEVPGGLLLTAAVCMTPLATYAAHEMLGVWPREDPGQYRDFYQWVSGGWFVMEVVTVVVGVIALYLSRFPFMTAPVAFTLWFMSMDLTPLLFGEDYYMGDGYQWVSLVFGLVMVVGSFLLDRRTERDYAFWGYLFGIFAFWGGLTALEGGTEVEWVVYGVINFALVILSVLLDRRVFIVFGAAGLFGYVGHLAWEIFEDSLLFPFALSVVGLGIIALGILYTKKRERIRAAVLAAFPETMLEALPRNRRVR